MNTEYGSLDFDEAITFFRDKVNVPAERWADIWQAQHNNAFTVAGAMKTDLLADLRTMVDDAIANGKSLSWFKSNFKQVARKHGWNFNGNASWRANVIYSTNVRQAYNAGRHEQLQHFEYWRYKHGDSRMPRLMHQRQDGKILPKDSSWWQVWYPQNGWGCKCKVYGESKRSLKRKGLSVSKEPKIERREWIDKATGESHQVPVGIDPGFDYSPGKQSIADTVKQSSLRKPSLAERLPKRHIGSAFSTVPSVDIDGINRITSALLINDTTAGISTLVDFVAKYETKTVIVNSRQMALGKHAMDIAEDVGAYLDEPRIKALAMFTIKRKRKPEGFTHRSFNHVTMRASQRQQLKRVNVATMVEGIEKIAQQGILDAPNNKWQYYASSQATGFMDDDASRYITWLHELGHQVHYKAGIPDVPSALSLTQYGATNDMEWFAEHFVFYLLANNTLRQAWPDIATYFDNVMEQVLQ